MRYNNVSLEVLIKGRPITEYPHDGRTYVEGRANSAFEVRVTNHNSFRVEAVISVDGLSVTDGKEAGPQSTGYVLNAGESAVIPGWKLSAEQVAAFEFAGKGKSYAGHASGTTRNTGVIGVMVFKDRHAHQAPSYPNYQTLTRGLIGAQVSPTDHWTYLGSSDNAYGGMLNTLNICATSGVLGGGGNGIGDAGYLSTLGVGQATFAADSGATLGAISANAMSAEVGRGLPQDSAGRAAMRSAYAQNAVAKGGERRIQAKAVAEPVQQNLGTAFGRAQDFATTTVSFTRGDMVAMVVIFYDDYRGLKARGIELSRKAKAAVTQTPNAFPGMGCAPPPGWRG